MIPKIYVWLIFVGYMMGACISKPTTGISYDDNSNSIDDTDGNYREAYARQMLSYMNLSAQPCDDFYEYACGNWKNTIEERQCEKHREYFNDIEFKVDDFIDLILKRSDLDDVAPEYAETFELAKKFYANCLSAELYPMRKSAEYVNFLQKIGGFPAINPQWNDSEFNWLNMSAHLSNLGITTLVKEMINSHYPFVPFFPLPDFGLDNQLHTDTIANKSSNEYQMNRKRMFDILTTYDVAEDQIDRVIEGIFEFLKATLKIYGEFEESQDKCDKISEDLDKSDFDELNTRWTPYFDIAWRGKSVELGYNNGPCVYFYREFDKLAEKHKEAIANYLSLMFLYHMDAHLKEPKFQKDYCTASLKKSMSFFFDHLYMKLVFNSEISDDAKRMSKEIQESLRAVLQKASWLDESTRKAALLKESSVGLHVGRYEDANINQRLLRELVNLKFIDGSYDANRINLKKFSTDMTKYLTMHAEELSNTTKPLELMLGTAVNAFFYELDNNMYLSASVFQPPTYHQAWPDSLKYGTIGFVLGHEFTHGFDTTGSNYDHAGVRNNWWSDESAKVFKERAQCFVDFYGNYTVPEIHRNINGDVTMDENIADAGALHIALAAYRQRAEEQSKKLDSKAAFEKQNQMPGMNATPEQLFFLGAAQLWCASFNQVDYWRELSDTHTIDKYRVLGMVSNNADFAKAYNCPVGSHMNPTADKCHVW